jgi:hypothetical protein
MTPLKTRRKTMAKIMNLIKAKVVECSPATDEKDVSDPTSLFVRPAR